VTWQIAWTGPARRDMRHLDHQVAHRIHRAMQRLAEADLGDVKRLQGVDPPEWRLRAGDWRVRFTYDFEARTIIVLRVLPRGRAYRD
jgi:mRNA interferase RelE/StbE